MKGDLGKVKGDFRKADLWPVLVVVALFGGYCAAVLLHLGPFQPKEGGAGEFGDSFGALSALFNGLAFAGLLITVLLQGRELHLQRNELAATREQVASQADSQRRQNELSFFFELMRERREIIDHWESHPARETGRRGLSEGAVSIRAEAEKLTGAGNDSLQVRDGIWRWIADRLSLVEPLFGVHTEMLRLIERLASDGSSRPLANQLSQTYANTLTYPEGGLLFYYGLTKAGLELHGLIVTHAIFRKLAPEGLPRFISQAHMTLYPTKAFGS